MIGWLNKLHHWSWIWLDGSCWIIIFRRKCSLHICELGLKGECWRVTDWYVKRMQLKHNLSLIVIWDPSIPSILIMKQFYQSFVGKFCNNCTQQFYKITRMPFSQRPLPACKCNVKHLQFDLEMTLTLVWPWCPGSKISIFHQVTLTLTLILKLYLDMVKM